MFSILFSENRNVYKTMWKNIAHPDRPQMTIYYGACVFNAGKLGVNIHNHSTQYLLLFHSNNGCTNAPHCYVIRTSPLLECLLRGTDWVFKYNWLVGFYNRDGECLLRGTDWVFKYNWLVGFYNRDGECLLRGTDWVFKYNWLVGFYNRDGVCLQRGTDWVFKYNWLVGFYNRDGVCLLRGTDWVFKYNWLVGFYNRDEECLLCGTDWVLNCNRSSFVRKCL